MHKTQMYENLRDMLEREVTEIEKYGVLDANSLDNLFKLMATIKNTDKCIEREGGMSYAYGRRAQRAYDGVYEDSYDGGMSNARRGRSNEGERRYSEDSFRYSQNRRGGSYDGSYGYSRDSAKTKMIEKLSTLMDDTMSEQDRNAIMDCIERIK